MKKVILMFPGQGSQTVGMGKEFYDKFPASKNIIDSLGDELKNIIFNGPEESLKDTKYAQPAIFGVSVIVFISCRVMIFSSLHFYFISLRKR